MTVRVRFVGSGDAFGSGGRLQTCISVKHNGRRLLLDCGSTVLTAMRRYGVDPLEVETVLLIFVLWTMVFKPGS